MATFRVKIDRSYNLANQNQYFGSFPTLADGQTIVLAFPVEGWETSAAVTLKQIAEDELAVEVYGAGDHAKEAKSQALAALSLNVDGGDWPTVGERDKAIGELQAKYQFLRPVLFLSPYEAATHFIIGHRISMKQGRAIRARLAEAHGDKIEVGGQSFAVFPSPNKLLTITEFSGLNDTKIERLHGVAEAALHGTLNRQHLLSQSSDQAKAELLKINGVGPFFAEGILNRGAGVVDELTDDDITKFAVKTLYELPETPTQAEVQKIAETWAPYRMWTEVLLHVWVRREIGLPKRR